MKKMIIIAAIATGGLFCQRGLAQVKVNLNVNLGQQPVWGPTGYDHADYYYLPDIDCYYDINRSQFIYNSGNRWVYASQLPPRYRNYNLYNSYKVVVNEPKPYLHADVYRNKYRDNKQPHEKQIAIRDSREEKYYQVKGHPMHNQWVKNHQRGRGHDDGRH
jgi:hypothetical protein